VNSFEESESKGEEEDQEEVELNVVKTSKVHPFAFKILLGLNFYGYDFGLRRQEAILGSRLIELLKEHPANQLSISWESESREHKIQYKDLKTGEHHQGN
jgi:hypothetical protein